MIPRYAIAALAAAFISAVAVGPSLADETLRVGKAVPESFAFVPLDIGMHEGLFKRNGIGIDEIAFAGDAKLQQAMAADSLDIALGSGPAMAFIAKGAPTKAIAVMGNAPLDLTIVVRPDGPKSATELKGKKISVSTVGGLTYWLVSETSRQQGWGPEGIAIAPMGSMAPQIAALERGDIDGVVTDISTAFMRRNKAAAVSIATQVIGKDDDINGKTYDELMPMFSDDGRFDAKALDTLANSYVELKVLPTAPDMSKLYTEAFLPPK
jgi:NitT/TauT family transport system substrate-binding protein